MVVTLLLIGTVAAGLCGMVLSVAGSDNILLKMLIAGQVAPLVFVGGYLLKSRWNKAARGAASRPKDMASDS